MLHRAVFLALFLLLLYSVGSAQGNLGALDSKNGFRDAKLGMPLTAFKGMERVMWHNYKRKADQLKIGDIQLTEIEYTFLKGKLASITLYADQYNYQDLYNTLCAAYGKSTGPRAYSEWVGKRVRMTYSESPDAEGAPSAMVVMSVINYRQIAEQVDKEEQEAAKKKRLSDL